MTTIAGLGRAARRLRDGAARLVAGTRRAARAAREGWRTVRPTTRRGAALGIVAIIGASGALAAILFVGATMAWSPYLETTVHPDDNPRSWAALKPVYAGTGVCADCHAPQVEKAAAASHARIGCESCHGALGEHAAASRNSYVAIGELTTPTDDVCLRCHVSAVGRPEGLRQVIPAAHFAPVCLQCHDPHTGISRRPPVVLHPLENLPPCATCHGPEGFKARNQRHPVVPEERCLDCHAAGRGPD